MFGSNLGKVWVVDRDIDRDIINEISHKDNP